MVCFSTQVRNRGSGTGAGPTYWLLAGASRARSRPWGGEVEDIGAPTGAPTSSTSPPPGRDRAREALASSQYVGPAPVPLPQYRTWVEKQTIRNVHVTREVVRDGFKNMVLGEDVHDVLGPSINSAKSLFLYGAPGNGKTMIAETISHMLGGDIFVPFAVEVEGQIMIVYDPVYHHPVEGPDPLEIQENDEEPAWLKSPPSYDMRFVKVRRPVVLTGGELTLEQLDLQYDTYTKMYEAPFQMKANGGMFMIDDFGRQQVPPQGPAQPLDRAAGEARRLPHPAHRQEDPGAVRHAAHLGDQPGPVAAGRRGVPAPDPLQDRDPRARPRPVRRDLRPLLRRAGHPIRPRVGALHLPGVLRAPGIHPRACQPRDILDHLVDIARFYEGKAVLANEIVDRACRSYFLDDVRKE